MKRILLILLITILVPSCQAEDSWDDFSGLDHAWDGQKSITNKEFEEAINTLEEKQTKKETKQRKKLIKKIGGGGTSLHPDLNPESDIKNLDPLKKEDDDGVLLNIPVNLVIDDVPMDKGFYKVRKIKTTISISYFTNLNFLKVKLELVKPVMIMIKIVSIL